MSNPPKPQRRFVQVCQYRSCLRSGSEQVLKEFQAHQSANVMISGSGCLGQCGSGPNVRVAPDQIWYCRVRPEDVDTIVEAHLKGGEPVQRLLHPRLHPRQFYSQS